MLENLLANIYFQLTLALATLLGGFVALSQILKKDSLPQEHGDQKENTKNISSFSSQCIECGEYISENSEKCIHCGTNKPFDAIVIIDYLNNYLFDIRSKASLYYKNHYFYFKDRGLLEPGEVFILSIITAISSLIYNVFLEDVDRTEYYTLLLYFLIFIYIPYSALRKNAKVYNECLLPGVNSRFSVLSKDGFILSRYKSSLKSDQSILKIDNKHSTGSFPPYVSFVEEQSNPLDRALNRLIDIKSILFMGKEEKFSKWDLDIKDLFSYLLAERNIYFIVVTFIVSLLLTFIYCTGAGLSYSMIFYVACIAVIYQSLLLISRRRTDLKIYAFTQKLEGSLLEVKESYSGKIN